MTCEGKLGILLVTWSDWCYCMYFQAWWCIHANRI